MIWLAPFLFACADRWIGGGLGWKRLGHDHGGPLRAGPGPYAAAVLGGWAWFAGGWPLVCAAGAWLVWRRCDGWRLAGHSALTPRVADLPFALLRHGFAALALGALQLVALKAGWPLDLWPFVLACAAHAVTATILARLAALRIAPNSSIEIARGLAFGLLILAARQL